MANIAKGKLVIENWKNKEVLTDGEHEKYDAYNGFASIEWPNTLTLEFETIKEIFLIRFLLWDGMGDKDKNRASRRYKYRLLTSTNDKDWDVHYDTEELGFNGWQEFEFPYKIRARYVRLHAIHNSANESFHIVEFEVYDGPNNIPRIEIINKKIISTGSELQGKTEINDGKSVSSKVENIIEQLRQLIKVNSSIINKDVFQAIIDDLLNQINDIKSVEENIDSIRREIINPVEKQLEASNKLGWYSIWGFWIGLIGGILAIISMILDLLSFF